MERHPLWIRGGGMKITSVQGRTYYVARSSHKGVVRAARGAGLSLLLFGCVAISALAQSPVQSCNVTGTKPPFCSAVRGDRSEGWVPQGRSPTLRHPALRT